MEKVIVTRYKANDGSLHDSEAEAIAYEKYRIKQDKIYNIAQFVRKNVGYCDEIKDLNHNEEDRLFEQIADAVYDNIGDLNALCKH